MSKCQYCQAQFWRNCQVKTWWRAQDFKNQVLARACRENPVAMADTGLGYTHHQWHFIVKTRSDIITITTRSENPIVGRWKRNGNLDPYESRGTNYSSMVADFESDCCHSFYLRDLNQFESWDLSRGICYFGVACAQVLCWTVTDRPSATQSTLPSPLKQKPIMRKLVPAAQWFN